MFIFLPNINLNPINGRQVLLFACLRAFTPDTTERGFLLLKMLRSYLELDMYASLTVHTEETLDAMEAELLRFGDLVQVR